ncbi:MAG: fimbrillin family protein [Muribaculaceae bacterium]|nr:fimbrillin family protein [Muribaculaceae bacterium]
MKQTYTTLISAVFAVLTLAGCSKDESDPVITGRSDCPDFTAVIDGLSRASNTSWDQNDKIGITGASRTNACYVTSAGNGRFLAETTGDRIYFQDENEITFTAYYPWNNLSGTNVMVSADTKRQTLNDQKGFDFLWAQAKGKKDAPDVSFTFSHMMAKVSFTVLPGDGMTYNEIKAASLSLSGIRHSGGFNTSDGSVTLTGNASDDWAITGNNAPVVYNDAQQSATYTMILFPQTFDAPVSLVAELDLPGDRAYHLRANIDFTNANRVIDNAGAKNEWVAGRQYNLSLTLHKTDITVSNSTIATWTEVSDDEIIVD